MIVRRETAADIDAIAAVTTAAFARDTSEPAETTLLGELRACGAWIDALSLVALGEDGAVVGHVVCSRAHVDAEPVLGLGPLSVAPSHQRQGVGSALVHAVLGAAEALGEGLVALLGDPAYYRRFGFVTSSRVGVEPPEARWGELFQARVLGGVAPRGRFAYPEPFDRV